MILTEILDSAGAEYKPSRSDENEIWVCCPFCPDRGESEDVRYRLGINIRYGSGHCFNCDWRGRGVMFIARQLCKVYGLKFNLAARRKEEEGEKPEPKEEEAKIEPCGLPDEYEIFDKSRTNGDIVAKQARCYLKTRGVSSLQIVRHKIGFAGAGDYAWRILFPIVDSEQQVHGCVGRAFGKGMHPKYLNTPGMKILWNALYHSATAVVSEGIMDALNVETALLQTRGYDSVARLGSTITSYQLDQLKEYEKVVVLPDWDPAGVKGAIELCSRCNSRGMMVSVAIPEVMSGVDPGSMTTDEILVQLRNAVPWSKAAEWRLRLVTKHFSEPE